MSVSATRWPVVVSAILASACTTIIEGPAITDDSSGSAVTGGSGGSNGAVGGSSPAIGGTNDLGGGVAGTTAGGTATTGVAGVGLGGTGLSGAGLGGTGLAGAGLAGLGGTGLAGLGGTGLAGTGVSGAGASGVGGVGGSASGAGGGSSAATFAQVSDIVARNCATARCHGGPEFPNLTAANLYTTLTSTMVRECGNDLMVTARDTANSAILEVVNGQCGGLVMPEGCRTRPCLAATELATISSWIMAGALR